MHVLAQPSEKPGKHALFDVSGDRGARLYGGLVELCGEKVAYRVGREISERTVRPVDVLETAERIIRRDNAEVVAVFFIPESGDLLYG